jgi:hypothetical protein
MGDHEHPPICPSEKMLGRGEAGSLILPQQLKTVRPLGVELGVPFFRQSGHKV